jgi:hypothetical protein
MSIFRRKKRNTLQEMQRTLQEVRDLRTRVQTLTRQFEIPAR